MKTPSTDEAVLAELRESCAGIVFDLRQQSALLERAAELGSVDARRQYVTSPGLAFERMLSDADAWSRWRERAPKYLDEAIGSGDGEAAMLVGVASMRRDCYVSGGIDRRDGDDAVCHRSFPLNAILPRNDVIAYAHLLLARGLGVGAHATELDAVLAELGSRMTADQLAQAEQLMQTLRAGVCCRS